MKRYCRELSEATEQAIAELAERIHSEWLGVSAYFRDDENWLGTKLATGLNLGTQSVAVECLRFHLIAIEMSLSDSDRTVLRALANELKDGSKPLPLSDPNFYRELDELIVASFGNKPITFFRLRQLSLQLTNYLVGFGDIDRE